LEVVYHGSTVVLERELSMLDKFVIGFTRLLEKHGVRYVVVSGYVAIVFGRSRARARKYLRGLECSLT
jgi:uncharacterized protein (DUF1330 family)